MPEFLLIWPDRPTLSIAVLLLVLIPLLYAARSPVHDLIAALTRAIVGPLRLSSRWLARTATKLRERNREVLFGQGAREAKLIVDRERERVSSLVQRDLEGYPALQRRLTDEITRIEEDFKKSGEVPPPPPEWVKAVESIASIKTGGDGVIERILSDIRKSIEKIYEKVVAEYRAGYESRHRILKGFMPFWRSAGETLQRVERNITGLGQSAAKIDAAVERMAQILQKSDRVEHELTVSASTQFFIAGMVMLIAIGGAFVNFKLIALPMSAMVGGGDYITDNLRASDLAALVIILFEALMGLFLMESLRFTHLFPLQNVTERMRRWMVWGSFAILLVLAGVEVALAVMRDAIIAADVALKTQLGTGVAAHADTGWVTKIPTGGQMILGFTLPFALAFVAIPLEYAIEAGRTVIGAALVLILKGLAMALRGIAYVVHELGRVVNLFYDVVIFAPLAVERLVAGMRGAPRIARDAKAALPRG